MCNLKYTYEQNSDGNREIWLNFLKSLKVTYFPFRELPQMYILFMSVCTLLSQEPQSSCSPFIVLFVTDLSKFYLQGSQYPKISNEWTPFTLFHLHKFARTFLQITMICLLPNPQKQKAWFLLLILDTWSGCTFQP